jgi:hypothetical protein
MIAVAAYYIAEGRGFAPGGADMDWLQAEALIDALLAERRGRRPATHADLVDGIRNALKLASGS